MLIEDLRNAIGKVLVGHDRLLHLYPYRIVGAQREFGSLDHGQGVRIRLAVLGVFESMYPGSQGGSDIQRPQNLTRHPSDNEVAAQLAKVLARKGIRELLLYFCPRCAVLQISAFGQSIVKLAEKSVDVVCARRHLDLNGTCPGCIHLKFFEVHSMSSRQRLPSKQFPPAATLPTP